MNNIKNSITLNLLINLGFGFLIYYFHEIFSYSLILVFFYVIYLLSNNVVEKFLNSLFNFLNIRNKLKLNNIYIECSLLFLFLFITQLSLINYETIDWDIATYMLVANDIGNGNLPYVTQWDDKGPLLYYFYYFLSSLAGDNFLIFKIFSDIVLFLITLNLYLIIKRLFPNNNGSPFLGSMIFLLFMSLPWATSEYSELFSLFFLSLSINMILNYIKNKRNQYLFISGMLFGMSTLTNQGSGIFIICFVLLLFLENNLYRDILKFVSGIVVPHILFLFIYFINGSTEIYLTTLFKIPLLYASSGSNNSINELIIFLRELYFSNIDLFLILILLGILKISESINYFKNKNTNFSKESLITMGFLITSFIFYFLSSSGYKHHLFFVFFFISLISLNSKKDIEKKILIVALVVSFGIAMFNHFNKSVNNLNIANLYENYPLKMVAKIINDNFVEGEDYSVFALDFNLISYYLDKPNSSKIIHPTNYKEESIYKELVQIEYISDNEIAEQISKKPDVIICSGETKFLFDSYPCNIEDIFPDYIKLELDKYFESTNRSYFKDPYRSFEIYIKQS
tara:strand:- start:717 stop:2423 length:1707 start_codon:yes stop_codon:yes gene_type:complete